MSADTVPADVRAAAEAYRTAIRNDPRNPAETWRAIQESAMTAALTASDAVRLAGAGDVAERLAAICGPSMQQCQCRSDQSDCVACTCGQAAALITTLRATIAVGWQPIATAPRDGTVVDLWFAGPGWNRRLSDCCWRGEYWYRQGYGGYNEDPEIITHWTPLPEPPPTC